MILENLYKIIRLRQRVRPEGSYVASLYKEREDRIIQKVGEEAVEVVIAAKDKSKKRLIEEMADLYFMSLILLVKKNITLEEIWKELEKRKKDPETRRAPDGNPSSSG